MSKPNHNLEPTLYIHEDNKIQPLEGKPDTFIHLPCDKSAHERMPELAELEALIVKIKNKYGGKNVEIFYEAPK